MFIAAVINQPQSLVLSIYLKSFLSFIDFHGLVVDFIYF